MLEDARLNGGDRSNGGVSNRKYRRRGERHSRWRDLDKWTGGQPLPAERVTRGEASATAFSPPSSLLSSLRSRSSVLRTLNVLPEQGRLVRKRQVSLVYVPILAGCGLIAVRKLLRYERYRICCLKAARSKGL